MTTKQARIVGRLYPEEVRMIEYLSQGKAAKEIARDTGINVRTVERYIANARGVLKARSSAGLVGAAFRKGLIQ